MMTDIAVLCARTQTVVKAQRLSFAIDLLKQNCSEYEVRKRIEQHYHCSRATAWRMVDIAKDVA